MIKTDNCFGIRRKIYIWEQQKWQHTALSQSYLSRDLQLWHLGGITEYPEGTCCPSLQNTGIYDPQTRGFKPEGNSHWISY